MKLRTRLGRLPFASSGYGICKARALEPLLKMAGSLHDHFTNLPDDDGEAYSHRMLYHSNILTRYDFEDTYDGLGDRLEETLDEYNDETFGASAVDVGECPAFPPRPPHAGTRRCFWMQRLTGQVEISTFLARQQKLRM